MIGDNLRKLRNEHNKTLKWLSEITGISVSYLSDLEHNRKANPTKDKLDKISQAFNVPITYIAKDLPNTIDDFGHLYPKEIREWLMKETSLPYVLLAKQIEESTNKKAIEIARKMLKRGIPYKEIEEIAGVREGELRR